MSARRRRWMGLGVVLPGSPLFTSDHPFFRGGGQRRIFTWDAKNDENFRDLNESLSTGGNAQARNWTVKFRLTPLPSFIDGTDTRQVNDPLFITPPVAYYDLGGRQGEDVSDQRTGVFEEDFLTNDRRDDDETDALWGPPFNSGALEGRLESRLISQ